MTRLRLPTLAILCTGLLAVSANCQDAATRSDDHKILRSDGKVAAALVARPWDPKHPRKTCKVYHHVYAPDGRLLTKGEGGKFEHHRGLFVGWNRTRWGKHKADFWHMTKGARQELLGFESPAKMGLASNGHHLRIAWLLESDQQHSLAVVEHRGLEVIEDSKDHHVLRMRVVMRAGEPDTEVVLAGDPQHAGQQLRARQEFAADGATPVRYLRAEGAKEHGNDVWTECGWIAAVLPLEDGPVTILRVESPFNPVKPTWSTRPYGRFGATRKLKIPPRQAKQDKLEDMPKLKLEFYYVIALGEQDGAWCAKHAERLRKAAHNPNEKDAEKRAGKNG